MKVIIIHYHFNPGGVTRIIEAQIRGLTDVLGNAHDLLVCGNAKDTKEIAGKSIEIDEALDYSQQGLEAGKARENLNRILAFLHRFTSGHPILHFHNPNLGKNPAVTFAAYQLASQGFPVINHAHDFPEDRPANLTLLQRTLPELSAVAWHEILYPAFPWYHFLVLNSCDQKRVLKQGIPPNRIHLMPNPVYMSESEVTTGKELSKHRIFSALGLDERKKLCTYPVRAIERKNLGEFLLLAAIYSTRVHFVVTQPPRNPMELTLYNRWKDFCKQIGLMVKFEAGEQVNHEELIRISDFCITTSIREGFGMAYMEPWLAGTPVIGRELPCITGDLIALGMEFPRLYQGIMVGSGRRKTDFKDLKQSDQEQVIEAVLKTPDTKQKLLDDNPFLNTLLDEMPEGVVLRNQQLIQQRFSIAEYGKKLLAIYQEVSA